MTRGFVCLLLPAVITAVFVPGIFADKMTADILYEKGLADFNKKDYAGAETVFLKALENCEDHYESCLKLAEIYELDSEKHDLSADYYFKAYDILMVKDFLSKNEELLIISLENQLSQTDKTTFEYKKEHFAYLKRLLTLAEEAGKKKNFELSLKLYEEVLTLESDNTPALNGIKDVENSPEFKKNNMKRKEGELFNGKDLADWVKGGTWDVKNGEIACSPVQESASYLAYSGAEFSDKFRITVKFKTDNSAGILFGFTGETQDFFSLALEDRKLFLTMYVGPKKQKDGLMTAEIKNICSTEVTNIKASDWNTLSLKVNGSFASAFLNNRKCFENEKLPVSAVTGKAGVFVNKGKGTLSVKSVNVSKK
ncbi:MAG: DUF1080 domain-containing protein [Planctomycetes bacterium]|nr:DUF1080 domain-containing protein [Planctomycetota bacterium]